MSRNYSLDTLKFLCAVLVIFLHVPSKYQASYLPLTRCAVPVFLMLSGYFLAGERMGERMLNGSRRMLRIIVYSSVLFAFSTLVFCHFRLSTITPTSQELWDFLILNENPWGKYCLLLFNHEFPFIYVRNFLFVGLPYFIIGVYMKRNKPRLKIEKELIWGGIVLFSFTSLLENRLLISLNLNPERDHYLSSTPLAILLFVLFYNIKQNRPSLISRIGERDSLYIYVLHPLWISLFYKLSYHTPNWWKCMYDVIGPLLILGCTIIMCFLLRNFKILR